MTNDRTHLTHWTDGQSLPGLLEEPDGVLLDKLHLREGKYLTRAAALLFHPLPESFIGGA